MLVTEPGTPATFKTSYGQPMSGVRQHQTYRTRSCRPRPSATRRMRYPGPDPEKAHGNFRTPCSHRVLLGLTNLHGLLSLS